MPDECERCKHWKKDESDGFLVPLEDEELFENDAEGNAVKMKFKVFRCDNKECGHLMITAID